MSDELDPYDEDVQRGMFYELLAEQVDDGYFEADE